jgi:hypothetical protein
MDARARLWSVTGSCSSDYPGDSVGESGEGEQSRPLTPFIMPLGLALATHVADEGVVDARAGAWHEAICSRYCCAAGTQKSEGKRRV